MTRFIAVSGAKGGVGKTTLATNLALALLLETGQPTVLVDLYTQFGDVAMLLNLTPRHSLAELAARPLADVDAALLDDYAERHESGLRVLAGSPAPVALDAIPAPFLDHVFGLLKRSARFVVLDVPPILHPTTLHALSHASLALLVANLYDLTTVKDTRLLLDAIEGRYVPREKIRIVLNRVSRQNKLCVPDIERALGHPLAAQVPNDGRIVPHSINQGVPFVLSHPHSAVAQSLRHLACQIAEGPSASKSRWGKLVGEMTQFTFSSGRAGGEEAAAVAETASGRLAGTEGAHTPAVRGGGGRGRGEPPAARGAGGAGAGPGGGDAGRGRGDAGRAAARRAGRGRGQRDQSGWGRWMRCWKTPKSRRSWSTGRADLRRAARAADKDGAGL